MDNHNHCDCHNHCSCNNHNHNHDHSHQHSCGCEHSNLKNLIPRLIAGGVLFILSIVLKLLIPSIPSFVCTLLNVASYIILGYDIILQALKNITHGHIFDENLLMSIASIGAFIIGEQTEAAAVMLFYQVGEFLQDKAVDNSRRSIIELLDLRPDTVSVEVNGKIKKVMPNTLNIGDIFIVKQGEKLALDGEITSGETYLDTLALTGESVPISVKPCDTVLSGSINTSSTIHVRVTKEFSESTVSKILEMVESAQDKKSHSERFISVFAKYYTPVVTALAALIMLIPSIITKDVSTWIYRGLIFLVVSCPCALVVSIPLGFFAGIGCASRNNILIKGSNYLEMLSKTTEIVFDKTGTITKGNFKVIKAVPDNIVNVAAYAEFYSDHPIAKSIKEAYNKKIESDKIKDYTEIPGKGISAKIEGKQILAGNKALMDEFNVEIPVVSDFGTIVYIASDNKFSGYIIIADELKENSRDAISKLNAFSINTTMLTGDKEKTAVTIAKETGIKTVHSELLPHKKVEILEEILQRNTGYTAFAGDGINDAPSLARADIGIAMGAIGADSAIEAADVVLMTDDLEKIPLAIKISKRTMSIIKQNVVFSISIKFAIMILSTLGFANMWLAIFADVGVALLAVLNSLKALRVK